MRLRQLTPLLLSALLTNAHAHEEQRAGAAGLYASTDSEDFSVRRASVMLFNAYQHLDEKTGLRYSTIDYAQNGWSRRGQQLSFLVHHMDPKTWTGWLIDAGLLQQGGHNTVTLDASYRKAFSPQSGVEVFASRDAVETRNALDLGRTFHFAGVSGDWGVTPHLTLVGLLGYQSFNDGNERRHVRGRIVYQPDLNLGLTLQLRVRSFDSSQTDVGGAYFNPEHYTETMLAAGWKQRIDGWKTQLLAGAGQQQVNQNADTATQLLEASAEKQESGYALRLRAGYTRSAGFGGPDYHWTYANAEILIPF